MTAKKENPNQASLSAEPSTKPETAAKQATQESTGNEPIARPHTEPARRHVLNSGALAAAALLGSFVVAACGDDDDDDGKSGSTGGAGGKGGATSKGGSVGKGGAGGKGGVGAASGAGGEGGMGNAPDADIEPLNALLSAEYQAITAYTAGAGLIGAAAKADPLYDLREVITNIAVSIQSQHRLHAESLVEAIETLGGTPVDEVAVAATFAPPAGLVANPTIGNVLKFAASAERGAAVAYNQVLAGLEDAQLRFLASSIEGDETQHFIVLAALVLGLADPGPNLDLDTADDVIPRAFVSTVGRVGGLDTAPPDYFA